MIKEEDKRGETSLYVMFQIFITYRIQMNSRLIIRFEATIPWIHASHYMTNELRGWNYPFDQTLNKQSQ